MELFPLAVEFFDYIDFVIDEDLNPIFKQSREKLKIFLYFILAVPLGLGLRFLRNKDLRLIYNLFWGCFFILFLARDWFLFVNAVSIINFAIIKLFSKRCFIPVAILSFMALFYAHYVRWIKEDQQWRIDFNVIQMILTCRYVYLASEQQDGKLEKIKFSFLEYYSYVFLFTNIIVGALPFSDFVNFMRLQDSYATMKFNLKPAMISFLKAVLFSIGEIVIRPRFDFNWFESQTWLEMNIFERHGLLLIIAFCARFKYFLAFKFTQAAMDSSGITFDGEDDFGRQLYTKNRISDYHFEIECNTYNRTRQWNSTVQKWLKVCFYDRIFPIYGEKTFYITFIVSALWHGFFLIYYLFFLEWAILNQVTKYLYKARNKFQIIPSPVKKVVQILYTHLVINAFAIPVVLLQWDRGVKLSNDLYWSAQIMVLSLFIFFYIFSWGQSKENQKKKS